MHEMTGLIVPNSEHDADKGIVGHQETGGESHVEAAGLRLTGLALMDKNSLIDERALAAHLQTSRRTVRRMVNKGQLPDGIRLGGRRLWLVGSVLDYLNREAERLTQDAIRTRRLAVGG